MLFRFGLLFLPQASEDRDFRKAQISCANLSARTLLVSRDRVAGGLLNCPGQSKPNSRMIKRKTIAVMLMFLRSSTKKSPRRRGPAKHRATDLRWRTRGNVPAGVLGDCICLHPIFLKRSKIDISGNL